MRAVFVLECHDDAGGLAIGVYTTKVRALAALRQTTGKEEFGRFLRVDSPYNPDWHEFRDPEGDDAGTYYKIVGFTLDLHC